MLRELLRSRVLPVATVAIAIAASYVFKLGGVGVLSTDEPRYAAIGRAMAETGDIVTPTLWRAPWFEKPPLLYWMTALGTKAGLGLETSARLPVALLSLAFLGVSFALLRREFGFTAAAASTLTLATCAGWLAFSNLALTDLPLAVFFSLALFLMLPFLRENAPEKDETWRFIAIGACVGLAILAKGLVPIALSLPLVWFLRGYWRKWWLSIAACAVIALPWYIAVYVRNGYPFIRDFLIRHHFERIYSAALGHVHPWYYYFPILLAGLFPWTPLFILLASRDDRARIVRDQRRVCLASIVIFGFIFFSVTLNKLPGYLLPLFPSLFVLLGSKLENRRVVEFSRLWLIPCALLIATIPIIGSVLPESLSLGRLTLAGMKITRAEWFYIIVPMVAVFLARRSWAGVLLVLCLAAELIYVKQAIYPRLDREVSARQFWSKIAPISDRVCDDWANRDWILGLSFYRGAVIPLCTTGKFEYALRSHGPGPPSIEKIH